MVYVFITPLYYIILLRHDEIALQALSMSMIFNAYVIHLPKVTFKMHSMI